jgi:release factor glutamine methyltransferase
MKESNPTIKEVLKEASLMLQSQKEAAILLAHYLKCDRLRLLTHEDEKIKNPGDYFALVKRRLAHEPVEYITNTVSFYSEDFYIAPGALIPRPETELLIDKAKEIIHKEKITKIAEIGTGSGIIAVMLAYLFPHLEIVATDISKDALKIAQVNAKNKAVSDRIHFIHTSYLEGINQNFDMIISNPPYIAEDFELEKPLSFEPQNALFGGIRGDEMLCDIIDIASERKRGYLLCEMGYDQKIPLENYMKQKGIRKISFYKDYCGFDRGFVADLKE